MKALRSTVGWFLMGLAGLVLGVWAVTHFVTSKVESGSIVSPVIDSMLHQEDVQEALAENAQKLFFESLAGGGIVPDAQQSEELNEAIADAVASEEFIDDVLENAKEAEADVIAQLTDDSLPLAPLSVTIDITDPLYTIIGAIPQFEAFVPPIPLEPIEISEVSTDVDGDGVVGDDETEPLVDADAVETIRNGYGWVETVATWSLWAGLGLIALGVLAIPRRRWIVPKVLLGLGLSVLFLWLIASRLNVESLLDTFVEEDDSGMRDLVTDLVPQSRVDGIQSTLWKTSVILLLLAAAGYVLVWYVFHRIRAAKRGDAPEGEDEAPAPGGVLGLLRKRWTLPKNLLKAGVAALVLWFLSSLIDVENAFTDRDETAAHEFVNDFLPQSRVDGFQTFMLISSIVLLVLAVAGFFTVWRLSRATAAGSEGDSRPRTWASAGDTAEAGDATESDVAADAGDEADAEDLSEGDGATPGGAKAAQAKKSAPAAKGAQATKDAPATKAATGAQVKKSTQAKKGTTAEK